MELPIYAYVNDRFRAMNTDILTAAACSPGSEEQVNDWLLDIRDWFLYAQQVFSRFDSSSELSRLNRSGGRPMLISGTMLEVLSLALKYKRFTKGIYDPFILPILEQAGYFESFETLGEKPLIPVKGGTTRTAPSGQELLLHKGIKSARLTDGAKIDLGGIVKGWSVDRISKRLIRQGLNAGMINAGGDLYVWGGDKLSPWRVEIEDPWDASKLIAAVRLQQGAAATSSTLGRSWRTAGGIMHHLIDPRTQAPSQSDVVQCTVIGNLAMECEIFSKVICILGSQAGIHWFLSANADPNLQMLLVTENRKTIMVTAGQDWHKHWDGVSPDETIVRPILRTSKGGASK